MRREWDDIQEDLKSISKIHTGTEQRRGPGEREKEESKQTAELQDAIQDGARRERVRFCFGTDEERECASSHMEVADDSREMIRWSDPVTQEFHDTFCRRVKIGPDDTRVDIEALEQNEYSMGEWMEAMEGSFTGDQWRDLLVSCGLMMVGDKPKRFRMKHMLWFSFDLHKDGTATRKM